MRRESAIDRPFCALSHDPSSMPFSLPNGECKSSPFGNLIFTPWVSKIARMESVEETRRIRLQMLVKKHGGMANLCETLGYARTETATMTRILNANIRHDRGGKPYNMGSPMARQIEQKLSLDHGWMDTPPTCAELHGNEDPRTKVMQLMEAMPPDQWATIVRLVDALSQPARATGTNGK